MKIDKRTFAASLYPKGSVTRKLLNGNIITSEYYTSEKWYAEVPNPMSDGSTNPVQPVWVVTGKTKVSVIKKAIEHMELSLVRIAAYVDRKSSVSVP